MRKPKEDYFYEIIKALVEIKKSYPTSYLCNHLDVILEDYSFDLWGTSDKEFLYALNKYKARVMMDVPHQETDEEELKKIIDDGMNLLRPDVDFINGQDY